MNKAYNVAITYACIKLTNTSNIFMKITNATENIETASPIYSDITEQIQIIPINTNTLI